MKIGFLKLLSIIVTFFLVTSCHERVEPDWKQASDTVKSLSKQFEKKYNVKYLNSGCGVLIDSKYALWDMSLMSHAMLDLTEARKLTVSMIKEFSELIHNDKHFAESLKQCYVKAPELNDKRFGFRLSFWDANMDRPLEPYVAFILVREGIIEYFYTNPKDQSLLPQNYKETFEEAYKLVSQN